VRAVSGTWAPLVSPFVLRLPAERPFYFAVSSNRSKASRLFCLVGCCWGASVFLLGDEILSDWVEDCPVGFRFGDGQGTPRALRLFKPVSSRSPSSN